MKTFVFMLICFAVISIICPIINYTYLYLASKLKFHQGLVEWMLEDDGCDYFFFVPLASWMVTFIIVVYTLYTLLWKPLYFLVIELPIKGSDCIAKILLKPIKKNQFKNKLGNDI